MFHATFRTTPTPDAHVLCFCILISAAVALLTCWLKLIYLDKSLAEPLTLVLQHSCEHAPTIVMDAFAKLQCSAHCLHVQVFYANAIISTDQSA